MPKQLTFRRADNGTLRNDEHGLTIGHDEYLPEPYAWWLEIDGTERDEALETIAVFRSQGQARRFSEAIAAKIDAAREQSKD